MQISDMTTLIVDNTFVPLGSAILIILSAWISIALSYLVFKFGWRKVKGSVGERDYSPSQKRKMLAWQENDNYQNWLYSTRNRK